MIEQMLVTITCFAMLFGLSIAFIVWILTKRPCTWHKVVALGGMGAFLGTVKGLFLVPLLVGSNVTQHESIVPIFFLSGLFAGLLQFRYASE